MANVFEKHNSKLAGVWSLISAHMYDSDASDRKLLFKPYGDDPQGKVVLSSSGYLLATLVSPPGLQGLASDDWALATDEEVLRVGRSLTSYGGFMTVQEQDDGSLLWHTKVEIASNPNWIGKPQTRIARFSEEGGEAYMTLNPVKWYTMKVRLIIHQRQTHDSTDNTSFRMVQEHEASSNGARSAPDQCMIKKSPSFAFEPALPRSSLFPPFSSIFSFDRFHGCPSGQKLRTIGSSLASYPGLIHSTSPNGISPSSPVSSNN